MRFILRKRRQKEKHILLFCFLLGGNVWHFSYLSDQLIWNSSITLKKKVFVKDSSFDLNVPTACRKDVLRKWIPTVLCLVIAIVFITTACISSRKIKLEPNQPHYIKGNLDPILMIIQVYGPLMSHPESYQTNKYLFWTTR